MRSANKICLCFVALLASVVADKNADNYAPCEKESFGCCQDNTTPAHGPNGEGCCLNSPYGCCSDNYNAAKGPNLEGCNDIPLLAPQKACSMKKEFGTCHDYTVKFFFDIEYGGCSRFWYSGCGGNANRFETYEECKSTCEQLTGKDACKLPKIQGPCTGIYQKYYYDSDKDICSQFTYGGCLGNANRFETLKECQIQCVVDEHLPACEQPLEKGPCNGSFDRWYFDKKDDSCKPFTYGGCGGIKNNFATEAACKYQCKNVSLQNATCAMPKATGDCEGKKARWYFSQGDNRCMPFYYTGCGGNKNSYVSVEECETQCPRDTSLFS